MSRCSIRLPTRVGTTAVAILAGAAFGQDLSISDVSSVVRVASVGDRHAYAPAFVICNAGAAPALFQASTPDHPITGAGLYRIIDGRFEQVGLSWMMHSFFALQNPNCGTCTPEAGGTLLGSGCADPNSASIAAGVTRLGPRFEVNPLTGVFPFPFSNPGGTTGNELFKRCHALASDLALPGALYLMEVHVISRDDAAAGAGLNNASYRLISIAPGTYNPSAIAPTTPREPAIHAWRDHGLGLNQPDPRVVLATIDLPGDGRVIVGSRAQDLGAGRWRYDFAIENLNSARAIAGLAVPLGGDGPVASPRFHDVDYHSGEPFDPTDWSIANGQWAVSWTSPASFDHDPNTNALRWGTTYSFGFEHGARPRRGVVILSPFAPSPPGLIVAEADVPAPSCAADYDDGSGVGLPDGGVEIADLLFFIARFEAGHLGADIDDGSGSGTPDGGVEISDLLYFLARYAAGC